MATWFDYLKVFEKKGSAAAWDFAQKNFSNSSEDYKSAKRYHEPTATNRRESANRQKAINSVTKKEIHINCQFDGFFK